MWQAGPLPTLHSLRSPLRIRSSSSHTAFTQRPGHSWTCQSSVSHGTGSHAQVSEADCQSEIFCFYSLALLSEMVTSLLPSAECETLILKMWHQNAQLVRSFTQLP